MITKRIKYIPEGGIKYDGVFYSEKTGISEGGKKIMDEFRGMLIEVGYTKWWFGKMKVLRFVYGIKW